MSDNRYPFPHPEIAVRRMDGSCFPVWKRYPFYLDEDDSPAAINVLKGLSHLFEEMLSIVFSLFNIGLDEDEDVLKCEVYRLLEIMRADLDHIADFAKATLPYDPWIIKQVQQALREHPEFFTKNPEDDTVDAALPVPPQDAASMQ